MILNFVVRNQKFLMVDIAGALKFGVPHCGFWNPFVGKLYTDSYSFGPRCDWKAL